jgi:hypothetical protein
MYIIISNYNYQLFPQTVIQSSEMNKIEGLLRAFAIECRFTITTTRQKLLLRDRTFAQRCQPLKGRIIRKVMGVGGVGKKQI